MKPKSLLRTLQLSFRYIRDIFCDKPIQMLELDYDEYWISRGEHSVRPRFKIFADIVREDSKVLDIGCGDGTNLKYLMEKKKIKGCGIDLSQTAVKMALGKGIDACVKDVSRPDFKLEDIFDYIIISELLEHIPNPEALVLALRNNFTTNLLISVPNVGYFKHRLRLCIGGRFPIQWRYHPAEHLRYWTAKDFKKWCTQLGFAIENMIASNGIPFLRKVAPNLFGNQIVFVLRRHG